MKRTHLIFAAMLAIAISAQAILYEIYYDPGSTPQPNRITGYTDTFINESDPIQTNAIRGKTGDHVQGVGLLQSEPMWQLYVSTIGNGSSGAISQLTAQEIQSVLDEQATSENQALKNQVVTFIENNGNVGIAIGALMEMNRDLYNAYVALHNEVSANPDIGTRNKTAQLQVFSDAANEVIDTVYPAP